MCDGLSTLVSLLVYGHSLVGSHRHPHSTLNNNSQREYNKVGSVLYQYRRKVKNKKICIIVSKVVEEEHIFLKLLCNVNGNNSTPQQASKNQPTNPSSWSSSSSSSCLSWVHFLDHQSLYSSTIPVDKTRHANGLDTYYYAHYKRMMETMRASSLVSSSAIRASVLLACNSFFYKSIIFFLVVCPTKSHSDELSWIFFGMW